MTTIVGGRRIRQTISSRSGCSRMYERCTLSSLTPLWDLRHIGKRIGLLWWRVREDERWS